MAFVKLADGRYLCDEHHQTFGATGTCTHDDHARPAEEESETDAPDDPQVKIDESWCRAKRDELVQLARDLAEERDEHGMVSRVGFSTVAKLYDTALKYHRAAVEERHRKNDKEHEVWLVRQHRKMKENAH